MLSRRNLLGALVAAAGSALVKVQGPATPLRGANRKRFFGGTWGGVRTYGQVVVDCNPASDSHWMDAGRYAMFARFMEIQREKEMAMWRAWWWEPGMDKPERI